MLRREDAEPEHLNAEGTSGKQPAGLARPSRSNPAPHHMRPDSRRLCQGDSPAVVVGRFPTAGNHGPDVVGVEDPDRS